MVKWIFQRLGFVKLNVLNKYIYTKASCYLDIDLTYLVNDMLHTATYTDEVLKDLSKNLL